MHPVSRRVIDFRETLELQAAAAQITTHEEAQQWLTDQWQIAAYSGDTRAIKAIAWLLKEMDS
jgi:hypothetical protein